MYVCMYMRRLRAYVYKLGQNVYIDINYVDVYLSVRRAARELDLLDQKYTYRPSVRLSNPLQTINETKTIFVIDTPVEHVKNILTNLINLIKWLNKCRVYRTHNLTNSLNKTSCVEKVRRVRSRRIEI